MAEVEAVAGQAYEEALALGENGDPKAVESKVRSAVNRMPADKQLVAKSIAQAKLLSMDLRHALRIATQGSSASRQSQNFLAKLVKMKGEREADQIISQVRADLGALKSAGARTTDAAHPSLAGFDFARFKSDSRLRASFLRVFPEAAGKIDSLSDPGRRSPIRLGDEIVLPYARFAKRHPGEASPKTIPADEYENKIKAGEQAFLSSVKQMLSTSKEGGSWKESYNKFVSFYGGNRDDEEIMSPELERSQKAHDSAIRALSYLEDRWGVPRPGIRAMVGELSKAVAQGNSNREEVVNGIGKKFAAVAAAPALWPVAAFGMLPSFAVGLGLGGAMMVGNAATASKMSGQSLFCNLGHELNQSGADTFLMSLAFAPLGALGKLAQMGAAGEVSALTIKWGLAGFGAHGTYTTLSGTVEAWNEAKRLEKEGYPPEVVQAMKEQAAKGLIASVPDAVQFGRALRTRVSAGKTISALRTGIANLRQPAMLPGKAGATASATLVAAMAQMSRAKSTLAKSWNEIAEVRKRGGDPTWKNAEAEAQKAHTEAVSAEREALSVRARRDAEDLRGQGFENAAELLKAQSGNGGFKTERDIETFKQVAKDRETARDQLARTEDEVTRKRDQPEHAAEMPALLDRLAAQRQASAARESALARVQKRLGNEQGSEQSAARAKELKEDAAATRDWVKKQKTELAAENKASRTHLKSDQAEHLAEQGARELQSVINDPKLTVEQKILNLNQIAEKQGGLAARIDRESKSLSRTLSGSRPARDRSLSETADRAKNLSEKAREDADRLMDSARGSVTYSANGIRDRQERIIEDLPGCAPGQPLAKLGITDLPTVERAGLTARTLARDHEFAAKAVENLPKSEAVPEITFRDGTSSNGMQRPEIIARLARDRDFWNSHADGLGRRRDELLDQKAQAERAAAPSGAKLGGGMVLGDPKAALVRTPPHLRTPPEPAVPPEKAAAKPAHEADFVPDPAPVIAVAPAKPPLSDADVNQGLANVDSSARRRAELGPVTPANWEAHQRLYLAEQDELIKLTYGTVSKSNGPEIMDRMTRHNKEFLSALESGNPEAHRKIMVEQAEYAETTGLISKTGQEKTEVDALLHKPKAEEGDRERLVSHLDDLRRLEEGQRKIVERTHEHVRNGTIKGGMGVLRPLQDQIAATQARRAEVEFKLTEPFKGWGQRISPERLKLELLAEADARSAAIRTANESQTPAQAARRPGVPPALSAAQIAARDARLAAALARRAPATPPAAREIIVDKTGNAKVHHHDHERQPPRRYGISDAELASEASDASNRLARLRHEAQVGREVKAATQRMYEPGGERLGRDLTTNLKNVERIEERLASRDGYGTSVRDIQDLARLHDEATLAAMRLDHEKTLIAKQQRLELLERAAEAWRKMNVKSQTLRPEEVQRALTDQYLETYSYD